MAISRAQIFAAAAAHAHAQIVQYHSNNTNNNQIMTTTNSSESSCSNNNNPSNQSSCSTSTSSANTNAISGTNSYHHHNHKTLATQATLFSERERNPSAQHLFSGNSFPAPVPHQASSGMCSLIAAATLPNTAVEKGIYANNSKIAIAAVI